MPAEQSGQTLQLSKGSPMRSTYHDNGDPRGGAVLFGERMVKVLFQFTCDFSLHIILLGGIILRERTKYSDFHSTPTLSIA